MAKTTSDLLVERLIEWGVDTIFGFPGAGVNGVFEALRTNQEKIRFIQVRHEYRPVHKIQRSPAERPEGRLENPQAVMKDKIGRWSDLSGRSLKSESEQPAAAKFDVPPPDASRDYRPIADYGVIGDMRTAALIASDGSIDWACLPYFDSPAAFCRLLDRQRGGYCAIRLPDGATTSRKYIEGTNILETTFTTPSGTVAVADFMPVQADRTPDDRNPRIIRLARCTSGHVDVAFECKPGLGFQGSSARFQALAAGIIEVKAEAQDLLIEGPNLLVRRDTVFAAANLHAGESAFFAISVASQAAQ